MSVHNFLRLSLGLAASASASAQFVAYPDEMLNIAVGATPGSLDLTWFGHSGRAYFLQHSSALETGVWSYFPIIERGQNALLGYGIPAPESDGRFFARTVVVPSSTSYPSREDSDGDKISNMDEIQAGLDPVKSVDSDSDGLPDDWEKYYFGDIALDGLDDESDYDRDGVSDADEYAAGRHPNTAIVYGTVTYVWAGEDAASKTVFFRDDRNSETYNTSETVIVARYSDTALTNPVSLKIFYDYDVEEFMTYHLSNPVPYDRVPTVAYTIASATADETGLVFTSSTVGTRTGRDLLRKIDDKPYGYVTSPTAKRIPAYLSITSAPLTSVNLSRFPGILRDFPYGTTEYPDFGHGRYGDGPNILEDELETADNQYERLPIFLQSKTAVESAESFSPWYRKPDAMAVTLGKAEGTSFDSGFNGINENNLLHLQKNDVGAGFGRLCYTLEIHLKLAYDIDSESLTATILKASGDDSLWVYVNGHLVIDAGGGGNGNGPKSLSDFPDIFPIGATTGTCDVAIFFAEQETSNADLQFQANAALRPIYAYQVVVDTARNLTPSFSLPTAPAGMTISSTGKIFWDYSQIASGVYPVEVQVTAGYNNSAIQSFSITVNNAPVIVGQPQAKTVRTGENALFQVIARGTSITYQWIKDGVPIVGATADTYTMVNVQPSAAGNYSVQVTNSEGTVASASASLTVDNTPYIITHPEYVSVDVGDTATFTVVASGTSLSYQWHKYTYDWETDTETNVTLPGKTSPTLTISPVALADEGYYYVVITNSSGTTESWWAYLYVNP